MQVCCLFGYINPALANTTILYQSFSFILGEYKMRVLSEMVWSIKIPFCLFSYPMLMKGFRYLPMAVGLWMVSFRRLDGSREIQSVNLAWPVLHSNLKVPTPSIGELSSKHFFKRKKKRLLEGFEELQSFFAQVHWMLTSA